MVKREKVFIWDNFKNTENQAGLEAQNAPSSLNQDTLGGNTIQKAIETPVINENVWATNIKQGEVISSSLWTDSIQEKTITAPSTNINITPKVIDKPVVDKTIIDTKETIELPTNIEQWKQQGSNLTTLEEMIEDKYWTVATQKNWVLSANIDWVEYQWDIGASWNPIKSKVWWEDAKDIYNRLLAWEEFSDTWIKQTPEYAKAKAGYDLVSRYINMSEDQLYNAYAWGHIWSNLEKQLANNPNLAAAKIRYDKKLVTDDINKNSSLMINAYNKADWKDTTVVEDKSFLENLSDKITESFNTSWKDITTFKDFMANNYPDLVSDTKELNQKETELRQLTDERDARLDEIIKENPWISINRATMLAARQNKDTNAQIKAMSYELGNLQANINYQTTLADKEYWYIQDNQTRADRLLQEQRWMQFDLLWTAQAQQYQQQQIADQRAYEQANQWVKTQIITDQATWQQALINSNTWEVISTYETWLKWTDWVFKKFDDNTLYNETTGQFRDIRTWVTKDIDWNVDYSATDFSTNPQYNTLEASFKNNNPTGITWGVSNTLKSMWDEAWVTYEIWTARPTAEGWNYVKFASVQDWLDAYTIALTQRWDDVEARLKKWVWVWDTQEYADDLMSKAWIEKWAKFSELSDEQIQTLMEVQLQRESPKFYNALSQESQVQAPAWWNKENFAYAETLTASDRTKFLKDRWLEDEYISYKAKQSTSWADFSDIQWMTDITFPDKTTMFKTQSFGFGNRMDTSTDVIARMEDKYKESWTATELLSPRWDWTPNFLKTSERQQYEQAQRNFVNAVLRQESWAAIAPSEFTSAAKQYFPATWDSVETLDQKRANREQVIENMYRSAWKDEKWRNIIDIYKTLNPTTESLETFSNSIDDLVSKYEVTTWQTGQLDLATASSEDIYKLIYNK